MAIALAGCAAVVTVAPDPAPAADGSDHVDRLRVDGPWRPGPRGEETFSAMISYPRAQGAAYDGSDAFCRPEWSWRRCGWDRYPLDRLSWHDLPRTCH